MTTPAAGHETAIYEALRVIRSTRGYVPVGVELAQLASQGQIIVDAEMEDRAHASLLGSIMLGPEAVAATPLSLSQTLVHELFHLHQNPFEKTLSFWLGVFTGTPVMQRYERPAYLAAFRFLEAVKASHPHLSREAEAEQRAVAQVFEISFGDSLL
jgi:hypothetical protein